MIAAFDEDKEMVCLYLVTCISSCTFAVDTFSHGYDLFPALVFYCVPQGLIFLKQHRTCFCGELYGFLLITDARIESMIINHKYMLQ